MNLLVNLRNIFIKIIFFPTLLRRVLVHRLRNRLFKLYVWFPYSIPALGRRKIHAESGSNVQSYPSAIGVAGIDQFNGRPHCSELRISAVCSTAQCSLVVDVTRLYHWHYMHVWIFIHCICRASARWSWSTDSSTSSLSTLLIFTLSLFSWMWLRADLCRPSLRPIFVTTNESKHRAAFTVSTCDRRQPSKTGQHIYQVSSIDYPGQKWKMQRALNDWCEGQECWAHWRSDETLRRFRNVNRLFRSLPFR